MQINITEWLEQAAAAHPGRAAYSDKDSSIDIGTLRRYARSIGTAVAEKSEPRKPVAVFSGRHILTPAAFLGAAYAGCFYAPIDCKLPAARIEQILGTLAPQLLITDRASLDEVKALGFDDERIIVIEDAIERPADDAVLAARLSGANEEDPLYIIFTSGSTGRPKGVITSHHSLMCYLDAYAEVMGIDESDVLGNQSPLDYIAAVRDIYLPLKCGCSTVIIPKELFMTPAALFDYMTERKVTAVGWCVSALTLPASLGAFEHSVPKYLKKICFSGSVMPCRYLRMWQLNLPWAKFVNQYGPTEATASCTYYEVKETVDEGDVIPIGRPYRDYRVFLLNEDGAAVPDGEEGEICVSGPTLALGYYNDPERTAKDFIQNPLNSAYREIIYKTGDIGVMRADGELMFKGRRDRQIKHLGHRVELDEIERAACRTEGVAECCVLYDREKETICLFYTGSASVRELSLSLRQTLPGFMIPRKMKQLGAMPKLPNGKTDMNTLRNY